MVQIAEVYKGERIDLAVDKGDLIFDRLKPWSLLIVKSRKLQLAPSGGNGEAGFVVDDSVVVVDETGKDLGVLQEYRKTLFDLTLQTLKEKTAAPELMRLRVQLDDPSAFFEHLQKLWHVRTPQHEMLEHAARFLRERPSSQLGALAVSRAGRMAVDLLEFLQLRLQVAKVDPGVQVSHVPIDGFMMRRVHSTDDFMELWKRANRLRVQASTSNNEASSRAAVTMKLNLVWPHSAYADSAHRVGGEGSYALSTLIVDDLPGAESAGDFEYSDPNYHVRVSETVDIGSDLLKLGLLLGRRTSPSGRKITEDVRCIDDRQAVALILLCGKLHHKDLAPTLRFGHHAGRTLVASMRQKQISAWLEQSQLHLTELTMAKFIAHVRSEAEQVGLNRDENTALVANLEGALQRTKTTDADLFQKLHTSGAIFAVLQDLVGSKAAEAAVERRRLEVQAKEIRHERIVAAKEDAVRAADFRQKSQLHAARGKHLEARFLEAAQRADKLRNATMKQAKAFIRNLQTLRENTEDIHTLEQDLLASESSGPDECPELSFGVDDVRRLRWQNDQMNSFADLAKSAVEFLESTAESTESPLLFDACDTSMQL